MDGINTRNSPASSPESPAGPADPLTVLRVIGLRVRADGGLLIVEPRDLLTDELREYIRGRKSEILAVLRAAEPTDADRALLDEARDVLQWREVDCTDWLMVDLPRDPAWARAALRECIDLVLRLRAR